VIIAAHRQDRPWTGEIVPETGSPLPDYDPDCPLCPGNERVSGIRNPHYELTYVFDNDLPCVGWEAPDIIERVTGVYQNLPARGVARVVCYSPEHNLTLAELSQQKIETLLQVWGDQYLELGGHSDIAHVLIFENKGEVVGVSNPHPHCQIYATNFVAKIIESEARVSQRYFQETERVLFQDILTAERKDGRRIVFENNTAIAFVPYFARYAYEVYVAPKRTHPSLAHLSSDERVDLAMALQKTLIKLDNLWKMPFPYVMPLHQAPTDGGDYRGFHFHIEIHPPLRKPNLLKYLAGAEIGGGNFLNDTVPEAKAAELRNLPDVHHRHRETNG
jgi:UDPglucose--hexose-1-phosphate uridylyltransferase